MLLNLMRYLEKVFHRYFIMTYRVKLDIPDQLKDSISSLALGIFDGFHRAHQHIAKDADAILTCHPHPEIVLKKMLICGI